MIVYNMNVHVAFYEAGRTVFGPVDYWKMAQWAYQNLHTQLSPRVVNESSHTRTRSHTRTIRAIRAHAALAVCSSGHSSLRRRNPSVGIADQDSPFLHRRHLATPPPQKRQLPPQKRQLPPQKRQLPPPPCACVGMQPIRTLCGTHVRFRLLRVLLWSLD